MAWCARFPPREGEKYGQAQGQGAGAVERLTHYFGTGFFKHLAHLHGQIVQEFR